MTASAVACAPATFDGLTGGGEQAAINPHAGETVTDPDLAAPRPISPISVSWVNTTRPKFRWELSGKSTGAIIEVSQTRDFTGEIRRFPANGTEGSADADLDPGMWFWRLRGRIAPTDTNAQEIQGPLPDDKHPATVWQMLVRGPGPSGTASDVPNGGVFDVNGDGIPDLASTALATPDFFPTENGVPGKKPIPIVLQWLGQKDGTYQFYNQQLVFDVSHPNVSLAGGVDIDGDGFGDFATASVWENEPGAPGGIYSLAWIFHGGADGVNSEKDSNQGNIIAPWFTKLPKVQAAGDVNGDGYGDIAMMFPDLSYAALGSAHMGASTMMVFPTSRETGAGAGTGTPLVVPATLTSSDFDSDGKSDIAIASTLRGTPLAYMKGSSERFDVLAALPPGDVDPTAAIAIASGDLDGDGKTDFAFTTTIDGVPAVCVYAIDSGPLNGDRCWKGEGAATDFGKSIGAADIDADGKDDLIVTTATGVMVLRYLKPGFEATPIPGAFRSSLTVLHPGRPGLARWAVLGGDAKSISVFSGINAVQKLDISKDPKVIELGPSIR
jgi:hypothetical protein